MGTLEQRKKVQCTSQKPFLLVWSLSSLSFLCKKKSCLAVFIFKTHYQTVDIAANLPPEHISIGLSSETIPCCNAVQPLAPSTSLPNNVEILHKLFSFCPSPIPGSPRQAAEPRRPSPASGRRSKCRWARGKHFWLLWRPCYFTPCINEFAACSNPSSSLKQTSAFRHKPFLLKQQAMNFCF